MRTMLAALLFLGVLCACGGGGGAPIVLGAPPPEPPQQPPPEPPPEPPLENVVIGGITLIGGAGGQAPHALHVRANVDAGGVKWSSGTAYQVGSLIESSDGATIYAARVAHTGDQGNQPAVGATWAMYWRIHSRTNSGFWPEGRWQYQFQKADGSTLDATDRDWMRVLDPISGQLVYTDDRYSAAPTAAFVFRSPGTYRVRVRYQNRDKEWSSWVVSNTVTVAANTRTKIYVNGATGNDSNDGLSALNSGGHGPKATLDGALRAVVGSNYEIEVADGTTCTCATTVDRSNHSGVWIHGSGTAAARPSVVLSSDSAAVLLGSNSIIEGLDFAYDGVAPQHAITWGISRTNVAAIDCDFGRCSSIVESGSDRLPSGVLLLRLRQAEKSVRYCLYIDGATCVNVLGCDFAKGSDQEHVVRIATGSRYISVELSTLDYASDDTNKSCFRCYARHVGVHRSVLARGTVSLGNIDSDPGEYRDYCLDGCVLAFDGSSLAAVLLWENVGRVVMRTSFIKKSMALQHPVINIADNAGGGSHAFEGLRLYNLTVQNTGTGNNSTILSQAKLTQRASDILVRGMLMSHSAADSWTWGARFMMASNIAPANTPTAEVGTAWRIEDCVHSLLVDREFLTATLAYTLAEALQQTWASGLIAEEHTLDGVAQPLGAGTEWLTLVASSVGVFRSLNGVEWDTAGPAGAWRPAP